MCFVCHARICAYGEAAQDSLSISSTALPAGPLAAATLSSAPVAAPGAAAWGALAIGTAWSGSQISYGFAADAGDYSNGGYYSAYNEPAQFLALSSYGQDIVRAAFDNWDAVIQTRLVEQAGAAAAPQINVGGSAVPATAWAYGPGGYAANGDVWFGLDKPFFSKLTAASGAYSGSYEYLVVLHEIGHALGLKHPHQGGQILDPAYDGLEYTVMSYRSYLTGPTGSYTVENWGFPQSLMMLDIAMIQDLYGADYSTLGGDTTYRFDPATGEMTVDGVSAGQPGANRIFRTLWDGGGTDLIDLSNYATDLKIDLRPGQGTDLDAGGFAQRALLAPNAGGNAVYASNHVYMSLLHQGDTRSLIENAAGGRGDDTLIGNAAANALDGGDGDDIVTGGAGADVITFGAGADTLADTLAGLDGDRITDFNMSADSLRVLGTTLAGPAFSVDAAGALLIDADGDGTADSRVALGLTGGATVTARAAGADTLVTLAPAAPPPTPPTTPVVDTPPAAAMNLVGRRGDDTLTGGSGDDSLLLRFGSDTGTGGAGADTFIFDWRYRDPGDSHVITDLDFAAGDRLELRFFDGNLLSVTDAAQFDALIASGKASAVAAGPDLAVTLTDRAGDTLDFTLAGLAGLAPAGPTTPALPTPPTPPTTPVVDTPPAAAMNLVGRRGDDTLTGGSGDDSLLLRFGSDTGTGGAGADTFIFDWRYRDPGDSHVITDLDFAAGDRLELRFFDGNLLSVTDAAQFDALIASGKASAVAAGPDLAVTLTDRAGDTLDFTLENADLLGLSYV